MADVPNEKAAEPVETDRGSRKRANPEKWIKNVKRTIRNSKEVRPKPCIACKHVDLDHCSANKLTTDDVEAFFEQIFCHKTAAEQNSWLLPYIAPYEPLRQRSTKENPRKQVNIQYFVRKTDGELVIVCSKTFGSITTFHRKRLNPIARNFFHTGESPVEQRGGSRESKAGKEITDSIIEFIKRFPVEESHYGRGDSGRQYMNSELNRRELWRMWTAERQSSNLPVASLFKFGQIFSRRFNLSFRKPQVDVCSYCEETQQKIDVGVEVPENTALLKLHRARAKEFYSILKATDRDTLMVAFDMQQNKPLPKTNVGEAYYSRQLWVHNVTFVIHNQKQRQKPRNVHMYKWLESESGKGSNEIVSALSHFFENVLLKRISRRRYRRIRFFCDSCPGQNKNSSMLAFLTTVMSRPSVKRYVKEIEVIFPIRGHSYLPPDRVFGRIEKMQRKIPVITSPAQYQEIDEQFARVYVYDDDWNVYDWKSLSTTMLKMPKELQISKNRVWRFSRRYLGEVEVQNAYGGGAKRLSLVKGHISGRRPKLLPVKSNVTAAKREDVLKLLQFVPVTQLEREFYDKELSKPCRQRKTEKGVPKLLTQNTPSTASPPTTPKPGRGRPRKHVLVPADMNGPPAKRPRGRPRKVTL